MCIIFLYSNPDCQEREYKLIIAANRDEYYERPSLPANFLPSEPNVLCGQDAKEGVEGGTWLGVTRNGRFGFLTNYLLPEVETKNKSRGFIVRDFLSSNTTPAEYTSKLREEKYRLFNFVGGIVNKDSIEMSYYGVNDKSSPFPLKNGYHTVICTNLDVKWNKSKHGSSIFNQVVSENTKSQPEELAPILFEKVLSDTTCLYPDELVTNQSKDRLNEEYLKSYCSVMITGLKNYGTRTQTVILVDKNNKLFFTERNISFKDGEASWKSNSFEFEITDTV